MYTNDHSPTKHTKHAWKVLLLILSLTMSCLLTSCSSPSSETVVSDPVDSTEQHTSVTPTVTVITPEAIKTPPPVTTSSTSDELSAEYARYLLEDHEKNPSYTFTLVSDHIVLHENHYYSFIASKNSIPIEPLILVDKKTGRFSCLAENGSLLSFSSFPKLPEEESIDWSGTYTLTDINDSPMASLIIDQSNSSSFLFYLKSSVVGKPFNLSGIAHCSDNVADFINEDGQELSFEYDNESGTLRILDGGLTIPPFIKDSGSFQYQDVKKDYEPCLKANDAKNLVTELTTEQTGLTDEISEYILKAEKDPIVVYDRLCYCINATKMIGNLETSVADFYVSIDGRVIFVYKQSIMQPDNIIRFTE